MARKKDNILIFLAELPWWVSAALAGLIYIILKYLIPTFPTEHYLLTPLAQGVSENAVYFALFFLFPTPIALLREFKQKSLVERQRDIDTLKNVRWNDFEHMVFEVYRRQGYAVQLRGGSGGDGGVDVVLKKGNEITLVQCKQWRSKHVGVSVVRELLGSMKSEAAMKGIVVTTGGFSQTAKDFSVRNNIDLVGGERLLQMVKAVQRNATREAFTADDAGLTCSLCGSPTVKRVAKRGSNAGKAFYGCSRYPACAGSSKESVRERTNA